LREEPPSADTENPAATGQIEVHVRELSQLFNSMDPSPFHERELDREAEAFILSSARELHANVPITLIVHLDQPAVPEEGRIVQDAVRVHFARRSQSSRRELHDLLARGRTSLAIGLLCLATSLLGSDMVARLLEARSPATLLRESLVIGGWVAMWRPMEIFLYDWWPLWRERRLFDRLSQMTVRIVHTGTRTGANQISAITPGAVPTPRT